MKYKKIQEHIEFADRVGRGVVGLAFNVLAPYFLLMFAARWFYIVNGIDYDPNDALEQKALGYFRQRKADKRKEV